MINLISNDYFGPGGFLVGVGDILEKKEKKKNE